MKNILILSLIIFFSFSCKNKNKEEITTITKLPKHILEKDIVKQELTVTKKISHTEIKKTLNWTHSEYFNFKNYKEYKITDTVNIDLNGNGILEKIYFDYKDCPKLFIKEKGKKTISIGCRKNDYEGFPNAIGWVDLWCVVYDKETFEGIIKDGEILDDKIIKLERPSLFVGKEEAGGGIITYRNGKLYWVHQSD